MRTVQGSTIWIARRADGGKGIGYLVTKGKQLVAFVRSPGERGLELAYTVAADPSRMIAPETLISKPSDPAGDEIRVDDLRHVTVEGDYVSPPAYLLNCYLFPMSRSGRAAKLPDGYHAASVSISRENGITLLRLFSHKWIDAQSAPAWLNMAGLRKEKTAKHRIKVNSQPARTIVEKDRCKAA